MKKSLLFCGAFLALTSLGANAETKVYASDNLGEVTSISPNGEYATVWDSEDNRGYIWTRATGEFKEITEPKGDSSIPSGQRVNGTRAMGVANDGTVVGCITMADGISHPAIYKEGKWEFLPLHGGARNDNNAIAITGDGKIIGGYQFINDPTSEISGRYYPCHWTLDEDGEWNLISYTDVEILDHQGFYPSSMSPDGQVIAGTLYCGKNSTIPAFLKDGELKFFEKITYEYEKFLWKGKWEARDEDGNQYFTDDPDDPNIVLYESVFINGSKDDASDDHAFRGGFQGVDAKGNLYGARTTVVSQREGEEFASLSRGAAIYNYNTDTWTDRHDDDQLFTNGYNGDIIFCSGDKLYMDGVATSFTSEFGISYNGTMSAMYKASADFSVIGGATSEINPASGEPQYFPIIIVLDKPLVEVEDPGSGVEGVATEGAAIAVNGGVITVAGAQTVAVYDINGSLVSNAAATSVAPGLYIVVADGKASKVIVK